LRRGKNKRPVGSADGTRSDVGGERGAQVGGTTIGMQTPKPKPFVTPPPVRFLSPRPGRSYIQTQTKRFNLDRPLAYLSNYFVDICGIHGIDNDAGVSTFEVGTYLNLLGENIYAPQKALYDAYGWLRSKGESRDGYKHTPTSLTYGNMLREMVNYFLALQANVLVLRGLFNSEGYSPALQGVGASIGPYMRRLDKLNHLLASVQMPDLIRSLALSMGRITQPTPYSPLIIRVYWPTATYVANGVQLMTHHTNIDSMTDDACFNLFDYTQVGYLVAAMEDLSRVFFGATPYYSNQNGGVAATYVEDILGVLDLIAMVGYPQRLLEEPGIVITPDILDEEINRGLMVLNDDTVGTDEWHGCTVTLTAPYGDTTFLRRGNLPFSPKDGLPIGKQLAIIDPLNAWEVNDPGTYVLGMLCQGCPSTAAEWAQKHKCLMIYTIEDGWINRCDTAAQDIASKVTSDLTNGALDAMHCDLPDLLGPTDARYPIMPAEWEFNQPIGDMMFDWADVLSQAFGVPYIG